MGRVRDKLTALLDEVPEIRRGTAASRAREALGRKLDPLSEYAEAVALSDLEHAMADGPGYRNTAIDIENPSPLGYAGSGPTSVILEACAAVGVLDDVISRLGLGLAQERGTVIVKDIHDRVLAAVPLTEWQEKLKATRGAK